MSSLTRTKVQLKDLGYPFIGIQLKGGGKVFGHVDKFTPHTIWIKDKRGDVLDVPRRIIERAFLLIKGGNYEDEPAEFLTANKS